MRADDGGKINGSTLGPELTLAPGTTSFTFVPGLHRGLYSVSVTRGTNFQVLEFWVGHEATQGHAGPPRQIRPPERLVAVGDE